MKRGATLVGIAFKPAWVVASCVSNIVNALTTRHISAFLFPIETLPNPPYVYTHAHREQMADIFHRSYQPGAWRTGKSLNKQRMIQTSLDNDLAKTNKVISHLKCNAVSSLKPAKARLIQAFVTLRDSYEFADEYRAFTHAITEWTRVPRQYFGMHVHLRSACGLSHAEIAQQITKWVGRAGRKPKFFIDDISNMDGNVQNAHLIPHYWLYDGFSANLAKHARASHDFIGYVRAKVPAGSQTVIYGCSATVKSGAQDTSSGQTTRRIDTFVRCLYGSGVTSIIGFVFGDDIWIIIEGQLPPIEFLNQLQQRCGWKTKGIYLDHIERTDFLACHFVPDIFGGYAMIPMLGRQLSKLFWTWRTIPKSRVRSYVYQVAEALAPRYTGLKFMEAWFRWHMAHVPGSKQFYGELDYKLRMPQPAHPHKLDWATFLLRRYNLPLPPLADFAIFNQIKYNQTAVVYTPWTAAVMKFDLADPTDRPNTFLL